MIRFGRTLCLPLLVVALASACTGSSPVQPSPPGAPPATPPPPPPPPTLSVTRFVAFGDSITEGKISPAPTRLILIPGASYPEKLAGLLGTAYAAQQFQVANHGVGAETAEQGAVRLPGVLASTQPDVVLLMQGTNDLFFDVLLGRPAYATAMPALENMVRHAKAAGVQVVLATIPPQREGTQRDAVAKLIPGFNDLVRQVAAREGAVLADVFAALSTNLNAYIGVDHLHPTEAGYEVIAQVFFDAVAAAFRSQ